MHGKDDSERLFCTMLRPLRARNPGRTVPHAVHIHPLMVIEFPDGATLPAPADRQLNQSHVALSTSPLLVAACCMHNTPAPMCVRLTTLAHLSHFTHSPHRHGDHYFSHLASRPSYAPPTTCCIEVGRSVLSYSFVSAEEYNLMLAVQRYACW